MNFYDTMALETSTTMRIRYACTVRSIRAILGARIVSGDICLADGVSLKSINSCLSTDYK